VESQIKKKQEKRKLNSNKNTNDTSLCHPPVAKAIDASKANIWGRFFGSSLFYLNMQISIKKKKREDGKEQKREKINKKINEIKK